MSTTADASLTITCPDWCEQDAQFHADDIYEMDGRCVHQGVIAVVADETGKGVEWSAWEPEKVLASPLIDVGVTAMTALDGRPTNTAGIRLAGLLYPIEQIEALIPWLEKALELARESNPSWVATL